MANIIIKTKGVDPKDMFRMMNGKTDGLKTAVGEVFDVIDCAEIEQENPEGQPVKVVFLVLEDGRVLGSNSATVRKTFESMIACFGEPSEQNPWTGVTIISKKSQAKGREYLDLDFVKE